MSVVNFPAPPDTPDWLKQYYERGFKPVFYPAKTKGPEGQAATGWTKRDYQPEDYRTGQNVGLFTGVEIRPGKFLVDVDFDWDEGLPLAKRILPQTDYGFGRASRPISHSIYTSPVCLVTEKFTRFDNESKNYVELRGAKTEDGELGYQTMCPPSIHPSGEEILLQANGEIAHVEDLHRQVALYAIACMLLQIVGPKGFGHDIRLVTAGFLFHEGLSSEEVLKIGCSVAEVCGNNPDDFRLIAKTTLERISRNESVKRGIGKALGLGKTNEGKDLGALFESKIRGWLGTKEFVLGSKGKIICSQENIKRALEKLNVKLRHNEFAERLEIDYRSRYKHHVEAVADHIVKEMRLHIDDLYGAQFQDPLFSDVIENVARHHGYHPVLDYLKGLKWDGVERLETWLIVAGGVKDTRYVRAVSKIVLMAAVRRVMYPGCKFDEMLVLESETQGKDKSSSVKSLVPNIEWHGDSIKLDCDVKELIEQTAGKWIVESADLSGIRASEVEHLKAMLSRGVDGPVRMAYGRFSIEKPRQFIIIGTTNDRAYLTDSTGNRRFWPVRIEKTFDVAWIEANRDQLWAEAYARGLNRESIRLDPALYEEAAVEQEDRRIRDPWEDKLYEAFVEDRDPEKRQRIHWDEIWGTLGISIDRSDKREWSRVAKIMTSFGYEKPANGFRKDGKLDKGFIWTPKVWNEELAFNAKEGK